MDVDDKANDRCSTRKVQSNASTVVATDSLETNKADRAMWLLKCPQAVTRALSNSSDGPSRPVAKVIVSVDPLQSNDDDDSSSTEDALYKSSEVFETFKQEIDKMTRSIKELNKENSFLKSKCEKSDATLIELLDERERLKKQLEKTKNQKEKLESRCRSLQAERKQSSMGSNSSDSAAV